MTEEVFISVSANETRVGVVEKGLLQEVFIERSESRSSVGNIYRGKVVRILPGMQSAFVDIGQPRAAFMHVTDLIDGHEVFDKAADFEPPSINELIHDGQEMLVQVIKESVGTKGARVTSNLSMASRFLVYLPSSSHVGISQKIEGVEDRGRLKDLLKEIATDHEGFIVRTAAEKAQEEEIQRDAGYVRAQWENIGRQNDSSPCMVYQDLPLALRVMRDIITEKTEAIITDDSDTYDAMARFLSDYVPEKLPCLSMTEAGKVLFDRYQLDDQIDAALDRNTPLKSGGYLVIDQTEAMTTVDVNTGTFVGKKDLEETIYRTNLEAAAAIPRQLRLRNIGGIIIIDFIDMTDDEHQRQVLRMLEKGQSVDRIKCNVTQISELGLVEMTRKRAYGSLLKVVCEPCEVCNGRGFIKSAESVCLEIFKNLRRIADDVSGKECLIMASQSVVDHLLDKQAGNVKQLADVLEASLRYQVEPGYTQEQYDIIVSVDEQARAR